MNGALDPQGVWLQVYHSLNSFPATQLRGKGNFLLKSTRLPVLFLQQVAVLLLAGLLTHYVITVKI